MNTPLRVAVGLSGGVDSAVTAAILKNQGYDVFGLTMKIWSGAIRVQEGAKHACFGPGEEEDIASCERLCAKLGIHYHIVDLCDEYEAKVLGYFRSEYLAGRTPNPCIVCNKELKFGFLSERARAAGHIFDKFATGHYARIETREGINFLRKARNEAKDQSYFLYGLDSARLSEVMFPLGEMMKEEVRDIARAIGLEVADKPESQDFIAGGDYSPLFAGHEPEPGDIVTIKGDIVGRHRGLPYYTVGQRRGIGISLGADALYVLSLDQKNNRVVVGGGDGLFSDGLIAESFRFQDPRMANGIMRAKVRIRQNHKPVDCTISSKDMPVPIAGSSDGSRAELGAGTESAIGLSDGFSARAFSDSLPVQFRKGSRIVFDIPQRAAAPGQSAVVYSDDGRVLGGGVIDSTFRF